MRWKLAVLGLVVLSACGRGRGKFAFTVANHKELAPLEQHFFQPKRFVRHRVKPIFERDDVLWYAYQPASAKHGRYYGISLQRKSLGYQEIDLRNRKLIDNQEMLIDSYQHLDEGEYRLKIAYEDKVIDQVDFLVVGNSASEAIDFESDEPDEI
jgi:hypothetical protein